MCLLCRRFANPKLGHTELEVSWVSAASFCLSQKYQQLRHVGLFDWVSKVWQTTPEDEVTYCNLLHRDFHVKCRELAELR